MIPENPLVSIIIPTYNRAHLIGETLDSVLAQTYWNWECIVVDDGSRDNTEAIINAYSNKDSRIQYLTRPDSKPKGANACRNHGFEKSKGEYIQWFDSDDLMHPDKLKIKLGYALSKKADVVVDKHIKAIEIVLEANPKINVFESSHFYIDYILGKKPVITNDVMVRREIIGNRRFDENLHKAQEYEFFTRLFEQRLTYCFLDLPLTLYRETQNSISKDTSKGNPVQIASLIYLSKKLQKTHAHNLLIISKAEHQGRKTYKSLIKRRNLKMLFIHFHFFRKAHHKSIVLFLLLMIYNVFTGRGLDRIKPN